MMKKYNVCVFGLGYVGLTLGVHLAKKGYRVHGVDIADKVLSSLDEKKAHFYEKNFDPLLKEVISENMFTYSREVKRISENKPTLYILTVGTTLGSDGFVNLEPIKSVTMLIKDNLREGDSVVLRSTVKVGVTRKTVKPILDQACVNYTLGFCPERTLEGSALEELSTLPQICSGIDVESTHVISSFFRTVSNEVVELKTVEEAEMVKLLNNSERDLIFSLANEIALMCDSEGLNAHDIIEAANYNYPRSNIKLPGPVGGPCLEKDPYILTEGFCNSEYSPTLFLQGRRINESIIEKTITRLLNNVKLNADSKISILGFAFKGTPPTGDTRGSAVIEIVKLLKSNGLNNIYGHDYLAKEEDIVSMDVKNETSLKECIDGASLVILQNNHPEYRKETWSSLVDFMDENVCILDFWNQLGDHGIASEKYLTFGNMNLLKN